MPEQYAASSDDNKTKQPCSVVSSDTYSFRWLKVTGQYLYRWETVG
jgi:hypothetical protein